MIQKHKAEAFRRLHDAPGAFVIANAWDAGSARLLETLGFKALAISTRFSPNSDSREPDLTGNALCRKAGSWHGRISNMNRKR